jgi:hypothetical protein
MAVLDRPHGTSRIGANAEPQPIELVQAVPAAVLRI